MLFDYLCNVPDVLAQKADPRHSTYAIGSIATQLVSLKRVICVNFQRHPIGCSVVSMSRSWALPCSYLISRQ